MNRPVPRALKASLLGILRETEGTVPGRVLAHLLDVPRLRTIGEAARELRMSGKAVVYLPGKGYRLTRSRRERLSCVERMRKTARSLMADAAALERGHSRQTTSPTLRRRRS